LPIHISIIGKIALFFTEKYRLFRRERQKRQNTRPLNRLGNNPLMLGTGPRNPARQNFPPLGHETPERIRVFVVNFELLRTKPAHFLFKKALSAPAAAPLFLTVAAILTTAFPVFVKRPPPAPAAIGPALASYRFRIRLTTRSFSRIRRYFYLLI
jgi:hypothetical protein